jgi:hypothetical protein
MSNTQNVSWSGAVEFRIALKVARSSGVTFRKQPHVEGNLAHRSIEYTMSLLHAQGCFLVFWERKREMKH